jgi:hypothetical protein
MHVHSLLHTGISGQLYDSIVRCVDCVVRQADGTKRRTTLWIRPIANHANISIRDGFLQPLVLFANIGGQSIGLHVETRIHHFHMSGEFSDIFRGIKESLIGIDFRCNWLRWIEKVLAGCSFVVLRFLGGWES